MDIKAVFSDIDSTLYSHKTKCVPSSAVHAVEDLQKQGIKFFLCSGRNAYLIRKSGVYNYVKPDGIVTMNGAQAIVPTLPLAKQENLRKRPTLALAKQENLRKR